MKFSLTFLVVFAGVVCAISLEKGSDGSTVEPSNVNDKQLQVESLDGLGSREKRGINKVFKKVLKKIKKYTQAGGAGDDGSRPSSGSDNCRIVQEQLDQPTCKTVYKDECSTVDQEKCSTHYEDECHTENVEQCNTEYSAQCSTRVEKQCSSQPVCHEELEQHCRNEEVCTRVLSTDVIPREKREANSVGVKTGGLVGGLAASRKERSAIAKKIKAKISKTKAKVGAKFKKILKKGGDGDDGGDGSDGWSCSTQTVCDDVPVRKCRSEQSCTDVPREVCSQVPNKVCSTVALEKCKKVPRSSCSLVPVKQCKKVPSEQCSNELVLVTKEICRVGSTRTSAGSKGSSRSSGSSGSSGSKGFSFSKSFGKNVNLGFSVGY